MDPWTIGACIMRDARQSRLMFMVLWGVLHPLHLLPVSALPTYCSRHCSSRVRQSVRSSEPLPASPLYLLIWLKKPLLTYILDQWLLIFRTQHACLQVSHSLPLLTVQLKVLHPSQTMNCAERTTVPLHFHPQSPARRGFGLFRGYLWPGVNWAN